MIFVITGFMFIAMYCEFLNFKGCIAGDSHVGMLRSVFAMALLLLTLILMLYENQPI